MSRYKSNGQSNEQGAGKEPIAIVGLGCRFPGGANSPASFWRMLCDGIDAIADIPAGRFDTDFYYDPQPQTPGKIITRRGGFLEQIDHFDAKFFGISPRESINMDPQQRLLLEVAWEALEDGGLNPERLAGSRTGVFVGMWTNDYEDMMYRGSDNIDLYVTTGGGRYAASGRLSYFFDFRGPSLTVDTASSSSLVVVQLACQSLWSGESELALAAGANLILEPQISIGYSRSGMLSHDAQCKFGDVRADGYVRSEGVGLVVLKPLSKALADQDPIHALIRSGTVNNDGRSSGLLVAPGIDSQVAMLREAYRHTDVRPGQVAYVEAHGSGTKAGDPVELQSLGQVLAENRPPDRPCVIGSVKTNIGHTEAAAGIAGLIKAVLCLKHRMIPPSLHLQEPNPNIPWGELPLVMQRQLGPWPEWSEPAFAGVNSFGITGTNAHIVLQEAPLAVVHEPAVVHEKVPANGASMTKHTYIVPLSAKTPAALRAMAQAYQSFLGHSDEQALSLHNLAYTLARRRMHHSHRLALVAQEVGGLSDQLSTFLEEGVRRGVRPAQLDPTVRPKIVFVFSGQGSQWVGMGRQLMAQEPCFREVIEQCEQTIRRLTEWSLIEQLTLDEGSPRLRMNDIAVVQPTLFSIQIALATLWRSWGIEPDAVIGQSMGEIAAAYLSGALTLDDALRIMVRRSELMFSTTGQGAMLSVELSLKKAEEALAGYEARVVVAVSNSPRSTVLAGDLEALHEIHAKLQAQEIFCRYVKVDVASHSHYMDPLLGTLKEQLQGLQPKAGTIPIYSTVWGKVIDGAACNGDYWAQNLRQPVCFGQMVEELLKDGHNIFIEVSPHPVLLAAVEQCIQHHGAEALALPSLRRNEEEKPGLLRTLGALYQSGCDPMWERLAPEGGEVVALPAYPWQRERFWFEAPAAERERKAVRSASHELLGEHVVAANGSDIWQFELSTAKSLYDEWLFEVRWQQAAPAVESSAGISAPGRWLILADQQGVGEYLVAQLTAKDLSTTLIFAGADYQPLGSGRYQIDPTQQEHFKKLLHELAPVQTDGIAGIIHLWSLDVDAGETNEPLAAAHDNGPIAVTYLLQALVERNLAEAPRLWLVTRGSQPVGQSISSAGLLQSTLWGLGSVILNEHPEVRCRRIDMDTVLNARALAALWQEIQAGTDEEQVALRETDRRYVARLIRASQVEANSTNGLPHRDIEIEAQPGQNYQVAMATTGVLDNLKVYECPRPTPAPGQVEIAVHATGLNFIDVMKAMGIYPGIAKDQAVALGGECSGTIVAVGEDVEGFSVGDAVLAFNPAFDTATFFRAYVTLPVEVVVAKPPHLSFAEAAAIPVCFLTAYYAMNHLGRLQEGERVLIHSATGGVGLAAIQLAKLAKAEIFATAGTAEKRAYLAEMGIQHIMDSRSLAFAGEIMAHTNGAGVDMVLNSLAGEALVKSFALLNTYGRFLEIGKRDIYQNSLLGMDPFKKSLAFYAIDLARLAKDRPAELGSMLRELMQLFEDHTLQPLPVTVFAINHIADAFRHMAQAKHTGKIVVTIANSPVANSPVKLSKSKDSIGFIRRDATYLISGGLRGQGLVTARWLATQGAGHLVLTGRSQPSPAAKAAVAELEALGTEVTIAIADVSTREQMATLLAQIEERIPPLRGIVHAAGFVDDGLLMQLDQDKFLRVMAPKVQGAWNLHHLTQKCPLDFFVMYSSVSVLLGFQGQGNYVAGNSYLDALAHYRRSLGQPALSINWGPWSQVSLAAAKASRGNRLAVQGIDSLTPTQGMAILEKLLDRDVTQIAAMPFDMERWFASVTAAAHSPYFDELRQETSASTPVHQEKSLRTTLMELPAGRQRRAFFENHLIEMVAQVLQLPSSRVRLNVPFKSLGMDSLKTLELRNRLEASLGLTLSATLIFNHPTIESLMRYLSQKMDIALGIAEDREPAQAGPMLEELTQPDAGQEDLTQEEVESLLAQELATLDELLKGT